MHQGFRISLLYLLFVIPQHGNNPLPDVESWLQKDQDDGSVQHDLTSSLTGGDESFGSEQQTYQNSLVRGKRFGSSELGSQTKGYSNFITYNRIKRDKPFLFGRNLKEENNERGNEKGEAMFEGFGSDRRLSPGSYYFGTPSQRFQNSENVNPRYKNLRENQHVDIIPSQDLLRSSRMRNLYKKEPQDLDAFDNSKDVFLRKRLKQRYAPYPFFYYPQSVDDGSWNYPIQEDYLNVDDERRGREISDQEYKNSIRPEGKSPQIFDENEYYDADVSSIAGDEDLNGEDDYNQFMRNRGYIRKRDETSQTGDANVALDTVGYGGQSERIMNYPPAGNVRRDRASSLFSAMKTRDAANIPDSKYVWKLNDDSHSQELQDLMKDSQRALQEVQLFQRKLPYKSPEMKTFGGYERENPFAKCEKRNYLFDGMRLKREDEDEQKNMKTGTDEGGGEYEDEEGKGHKDEEEYYEDADLTGSESKNEGPQPDELNQKYVKREILQDAGLKLTKNEANDQSEEYELNLENAPVEHADKSKKSTYREGEKTNKNTMRKGVKIWDQWGKWSPCSVTCGVGRSTRWRHCIGGGCAQGEKEAQIKRCTNPAC